MGDLYFIESKGRNSLIYKDGFQSIQCGIMILNDTEEFKKKKRLQKKRGYHPMLEPKANDGLIGQSYYQYHICMQ